MKNFQEYRGVKIELKGNILGLWNVYIEQVEQEAQFLYDFEAMEYAKSLIRLGLRKPAPKSEGVE